MANCLTAIYREHFDLHCGNSNAGASELNFPKNKLKEYPDGGLIFIAMTITKH